MKKNTVIISGLLIVAVGTLFFMLNQGGHLPLDKLLSGVRTQSPETSPAVAPEAVAVDEGGSGADVGTPELELEHIRRLLANVNAERRQALLDDAESFREFVRQEALNQSLLAAARSNGLQDEPDVQFLMERNANNVLREVYLNRLLMNNMPS
ncbi:MAG: hypothetical protein WD709_07170, partial [Gammaproteobacteria bacterium]